MMNPEAIGISFKFTRECTNYLAPLFENISIQKYTWYICYTDAYYTYNGEGELSPILSDGIYSGQEFYSKINSKPYFIIRICLYAVPNGKEFDTSKICVYEDYAKSSAEIAFICVDNIVDMYVKDRDILETIFESCKKCCENGLVYPSPEYITPENDTRTGLIV